MSWIPDPSTRHPLSWPTFTRDCLPPILLYYVTALLVITPRTFPIRLALLPITLYAAFRCATHIDLVKGYPDEEHLVYLNQGLVLAMTTLGTRASIWTFQIDPYQRLQKYRPSPTPNAFLDALDLCFNLRGIGWSWSSGLKIPTETRNTSSKLSFILSTLRSLLISFVCFDFFHLAVQSFSLPLSTLTTQNTTNTFASPSGASIFDPALPPPIRYLRSSLITFLSGLVVYHAIHTLYLLVSLVSLTLLAHTPAQWPPVFHAPWFATSLNEFWACRWHQVFRHLFIAAGGTPVLFLFGRAASVLGVFLVSALLHYIGLWGMRRGTDFARVGGFFLMMGVGTLAEHAYRALTGRRVGGVAGWAWAVLWVLGWANLLVEAWLIRGLAGSAFLPHASRPSVLVLRWVDSWIQIP
ncbi:hypothetical protein GALMADRAFT_247761 [Galerina marginata CBS 339.88]|uniref:Wax synthase domain-containing protein n=1 Tax=Galerina marginata (strain CBS 339.88) TaxID=685588 RepID=A0A067SZI6_GALM3|nr:hypothetical protein GALMADRAFT_247761 [Galerina marginata CBS 339.88]